MKKNSILLFAASLILTMVISVPVSAQKKQPVGVRMEITEAETDKGDFTVFTYVDEDDTFGYYLGLGRVSQFLGADEILGMQVDNIKETCILLGGTYDEAYASLGSMMDLFDKDLDTTVEFKGRATTSGERLGEPNVTTCVVQKKPLGGKRLAFIFPFGKRQAHTYISKSVLKELRFGLKMDKKLHPKQHR